MSAVRHNDASAELLATLRQVLPESQGPFQLHEPEITAAEEARVLETLREGFVSYAGRHVTLFEEQLAKTCGTAKAIAIVSGTTAIQVTLMALGVGPGDEVLCPSLTFVATANAIVHAGAVPHFVDCSEHTLGLDADKLDRRLRAIATQSSGVFRNKETGNRIAAIMPVHIFGHVGDLAGLRRVAAEWNIPIVEDATEALGSRDAAGLLFNFGVAATLSFNGNKIVTTGGGGAILTNDLAFASHLKHLTTTAKRPHPWRFDHDVIGYNHRMPNINAALGLAQLDRLDDFVARKRKLADGYRKAFSVGVNWKFFEEPAGSKSNYWLNVAMISSPDEPLLEKSLADLHAAGYHCRPCWRPMHHLDIHAKCPRDALPVTENLAARIICLPSSPKLSEFING